MTRRAQRVLTWAVLAPVVAFWALISPYAIGYVLNPPEPPYDQPSLLPGLLMYASGCTGVAFILLAGLLYAARLAGRRAGARDER